MFDISWGELILIGMVALIVIGPKELPTVLRTMGQYMTKIRRMAAEFQGQFNEAMREAEMSDLKDKVDGLRDTAKSFNPMQTIRDEFQNAKSQFDAATKDVGVSSADLTPSAGGTPSAPAADISTPMPEMPPPVNPNEFVAPPTETAAPAPAVPEAHPERAALDGAPAPAEAPKADAPKTGSAA